MIPVPAASSLRVAAATLAAALLSACSDGGAGPNRSAQVGVGFQLARNGSAAAPLSADGSPLIGGTGGGTTAATETTPAGFVITRGADEILVTRAQVVVKDVKLASAIGCTDDDDDDDDDDDRRSDGRGSDSRRGDDDDDDDDCPTLRVGPFLVDVPVSGADGGRVAVSVPEGTYSRVRLSIHKVSSSNTNDLAFRQANPDFRNISVRLTGFYNDQPFTFVSDVNAKLDIPLTSPLTIGEGGDDVTVTIDLAPWFVNPSGGLYSPALANTPGQVQARVQNNIRSAFRAFRDRDRDGRDD